jgi:hypothetical protein
MKRMTTSETDSDPLVTTTLEGICSSLHRSPMHRESTNRTFVIPTGAYPDFLPHRTRRRKRVRLSVNCVRNHENSDRELALGVPGGKDHSDMVIRT